MVPGTRTHKGIKFPEVLKLLSDDPDKYMYSINGREEGYFTYYFTYSADLYGVSLKSSTYLPINRNGKLMRVEFERPDEGFSIKGVTPHCISDPMFHKDALRGWTFDVYEIIQVKDLVKCEI